MTDPAANPDSDDVTGPGASDPGAARPRSWALTAAWGLVAVGLLAFLYAIAASLSKPDDGGYRRFARGAMTKLEVLHSAPAQPTQAFLTADGFEMTLARFRGRVVVMNLWGTWCAPCVEEMPTLGALARAYADKPVSVVAINLDPVRLRTEATGELDRLTQGALKFYTDPTLQMAFASGATQGMPVTVIYGKDGRELARMLGAADWASPEARALIDAALAEQGT